MALVGRKRQEVPSLMCSHEDADTRLLWHTNHICETQPESKVVIRCNDTDILVVLLTYVLSFTGHIWMSGTQLQQHTAIH